MKKLTIIICDNDEDELLFAREGFEKSGLFEVMATVESGSELLDYVGNLNSVNLPNLVLSDLNMPGINGYGVLENFASNPGLGGVPVYISSTSSSQTSIDKCKKLGAKDYLVKPELFNRYDQFACMLYQKILVANTPLHQA